MNLLYKSLKEKIKNHYTLFIILYNIRAYVLCFINRISHYQLEKIRFYQKLGYPLNLKNPQFYNEKIVWKKIYDRNPLLPVTADKYQVRSYIKKMLGEEKAKEILIPLFYVTDQPETIPFDRLPPSFIVKSNHASGRNIIVRNDHYIKEKIIKTCKGWLKIPYGLEKLEWAYQHIKRIIIFEKLLQDDDGSPPERYDFQMFHGKCKLVHAIIVNKINNTSITSFDEKWDFLLIKIAEYPQEPKIKKPENYEEMLELAEKLSQPFDHVRVDLYNLNGKIYFGELTHYAASGTGKFKPQSFDFELGKYWKIEPKYWNRQIKTQLNNKLFRIRAAEEKVSNSV